jgi:CelD/BcsL family acetyltransferase involved in cellulose biosynthesis
VVESFASTAELPADALSLLDSAGNLFASRVWWDVVMSDAMPEDTAPAFMLCRCDGRAVALVPMARRGRSLESLTTPYTCRYAPLFPPGLDRAAQAAAMRGFATACRKGAVTRLDALPAGCDGLAALEAGARQAGLFVLRFDHFGNWHEDVAGLDWAGYLARRPGALRETIRRRLRRAEKLPAARFSLLSQPADMDEAAEVFEAVYARSWKEPEPFPRFNVALMRVMAAAGLLRFGAWWVGATPVAVQVWVQEHGHATVLKLAHDEAFKAHSPGTVLTALMLRHLLDQEHVTEIDFGRGDDDYKQGWAARRRQRIGLLLVNPLKPAGLATLLRHGAGRGMAGLRRVIGR